MICFADRLLHSHFIHSSCKYATQNLSNTVKIDQQMKRLRVAVVGMPNVGKSTLINALTGINILPVSKKIDTTTRNTVAILTEGNVQIEFQDSPGIHSKTKSKRHKKSFTSSNLPSECISDCDLCMVVADLSCRRTSSGYLHPEVLLHLLLHKHVPAVLVLNKIDQITNRDNVFQTISHITCGKLNGKTFATRTAQNKSSPNLSLLEIETEIIDTYDKLDRVSDPSEIRTARKSEAQLMAQLRSCRGWPSFTDVFVTSGLKYENVQRLKRYILSQAVAMEWRYSKETVTDSNMFDIVKDAMRASLLDALPQEVPYQTQVKVSDWRDTDTELIITLQLVCGKIKHKKYIAKAKKLLCYSTKRRLHDISMKNIEIHVMVT